MPRGENFRKYTGNWHRVIEGGELFMPNHDVVILKEKNIETHFHDYFAPIGHYYESWAPFVARLKKRKHLNSQQVHTLAAHYQIQKNYRVIDNCQLNKRRNNEKR